MFFQKSERIFVVRIYFETKFLEAVKKRFIQTFLNSAVPVKSTILRLVKKSSEIGEVGDTERMGKRKSATVVEFLDSVQVVICEQPETYIYRTAEAD